MTNTECPVCSAPALAVESRSDGVTFYKHPAGVWHLTGVPVRLEGGEVLPLY